MSENRRGRFFLTHTVHKIIHTTTCYKHSKTLLNIYVSTRPRRFVTFYISALEMLLLTMQTVFLLSHVISMLVLCLCIVRASTTGLTVASGRAATFKRGFDEFGQKLVAAIRVNFLTSYVLLSDNVCRTVKISNTYRSSKQDIVKVKMPLNIAAERERDFSRRPCRTNSKLETVMCTVCMWV